MLTNTNRNPTPKSCSQSHWYSLDMILATGTTSESNTYYGIQSRFSGEVDGARQFSI